MPTRVMKKPTACKRLGGRLDVARRPAAHFIPKRGLARLVMRRPAGGGMRRSRALYTKVARPSRQWRRYRPPSITIDKFFGSSMWLTCHLVKMGFLKVPSRCDKCGAKRMQFEKGMRQGSRSSTRCSNSSCRRHLSLYTGNPFFHDPGHAVSLGHQAAILYNLSIGVSHIHTHLHATFHMPPFNS